ncbi:hypothetical protein QBC41DRAFT_398138 [Cercophora samala]|uniref:RING-type domain-containing protein n=1 Tax=Cercophora samala TaxID=330535 RepID=A0AA39Z940_9PEZI|nr:hypothetical protein QBC41DRAFT_398138 [Cercophora samala]
MPFPSQAYGPAFQGRPVMALQVQQQTSSPPGQSDHASAAATREEDDSDRVQMRARDLYDHSSQNDDHDGNEAYEMDVFETTQRVGGLYHYMYPSETTSLLQIRLSVKCTGTDSHFCMTITDGPLLGIQICIDSRSSGVGPALKTLMSLFTNKHLRIWENQHLVFVFNHPHYAPVVSPRIELLHTRARPPPWCGHSHHPRRFGLARETVIQALGGPTNFKTWQETMLYYILYQEVESMFRRQLEGVPRPTDVRQEELPENMRQMDAHLTGGVYQPPSGIADLVADAVDTREIKADEDMCCYICLEDMKPGEEAARIKACPHGCFHHGCLTTWLKTNNTCPSCRARVYDESEFVDTQAWLGRGSAALDFLTWTPVY